MRHIRNPSAVSNNILPGKRNKQTIGFWKNENNVQHFLKDLQNKLHLNSPEDWKLLSSKQIRLYGGGSLLSNYSLYELKSIGCPEGINKFTKRFSKNKSGYWDKQENIQNFINQLSIKLKLKNFDDWNSITAKDIKLNGGNALLSKLSLYKIKEIGYPEGKSKFYHESNKKQTGYWQNKENVQQFLLNLKEKLNLRSPNDWNLLTARQIKSFGGSSLLHHYPLYSIKALGCPEGKLLFNPPKIENKPSRYWKNENNVQKFLFYLKEKLNLETVEDWNSISQQQIIENGGCSILNIYSLYEIKCMGFPDGKLYFDKPQKPPGYWDKEENIIEFIKEIEEKFEIKSSNNWNRISKNQILSLGGGSLFTKYSIHELINKKIDYKFKSNSRASQRWLFLQIQKLFPCEEIIEDYFHSGISRESGFHVQFDIFILNKNIAFEYHGKQHYEDMPAAFAPVELYQLRDKEKKELCDEFNIKLIVIPFWWDNSLESLKAYCTKALLSN